MMLMQGCCRSARDLIEAIMARVPFPFIFKACCLSKSWCLKLGSRPSSSGAKSLPLNVGFEKQIALGSARWPSFSPTHVGRDGIFTYDKNAKQWRLLPLDLSSFPHRISHVRCFASLVCIIGSSWDKEGIGPDIFVMNAITKHSKLLPHCFLSDEHMHEQRQSPYVAAPQEVTIFSSGAKGYKVLCVYQSPSPDFPHPLPKSLVYTYIYDLEVETWTAQESREVPGHFQGSAYMDGKLYCLNDNWDPSLWLWVYDVSKNYWTRGDTLEGYICDSAILRCGEKLLYVTQHDAGSRTRKGICRYKYRIRIFEIILDCMQGKEVHTWPPAGRAGSTFGYTLEFASDAEFVYFIQVDDNKSLYQETMVRFNVHSHEWSSLPPTEFPDWGGRHWGDVFEPGLNPFIRV